MEKGRGNLVRMSAGMSSVGHHIMSMTPCLLDEVADVMVFYVNMCGLRRGRVVGSKGNTTFVDLKGVGWANNGRTNSKKDLTKTHDFMRESSDIHVLRLGYR